MSGSFGVDEGFPAALALFVRVIDAGGADRGASYPPLILRRAGGTLMTRGPAGERGHLTSLYRVVWQS